MFGEDDLNVDTHDSYAVFQKTLANLNHQNYKLKMYPNTTRVYSKVIILIIENEFSWRQCLCRKYTKGHGSIYNEKQIIKYNEISKNECKKEHMDNN
jgi:hypothetical protein